MAAAPRRTPPSHVAIRKRRLIVERCRKWWPLPPVSSSARVLPVGKRLNDIDIHRTHAVQDESIIIAVVDCWQRFFGTFFSEGIEFIRKKENLFLKTFNGPIFVDYDYTIIRCWLYDIDIHRTRAVQDESITITVVDYGRFFGILFLRRNWIYRQKKNLLLKTFNGPIFVDYKLYVTIIISRV